MTETTTPRIKPLTIALLIALLFGAYFLRHYFSLIVLAAIVAYTFNPVYKRFARKFKNPSSAASLTLLVSILALLLPIALVVILSVFQVRNLIDSFSASHIDLGKIGRDTLDWVNNGLLSYLPGDHQITLDQIQSYINKAVSAIGAWFLGVLSSSVSGLAGFFTSVILYIYIFLNLLTHQDHLISTVKRLNPLGAKTSDLYLQKMGAMTGAMVRGQFIIALLQGLTSAIFLYIAGLHDIFFFMLIILTILSIIPLGAGIITMPIGIVMILMGDIWQGALILLGHILVVTNIDNFLRPVLVPKHVRLNPALTLLSVFAGIATFGFLGIIIGPVIMILITTTIEMYTQANSGKAKT
jgi:predicted PurR-regulated permease PerM